MTKTTYCGATFNLITGDELGERIDAIQDRWGPNWRDDPVKRLVMETFNSCEHFISHYEDAARVRASAPSLLPMMAEMFPSRAVANHTADSQCHALGGESEDEPARLRGNGAL